MAIGPNPEVEESPTADQGSATEGDPLSRYPRTVAVILVLVALALTVASLKTGVSSGLPTIALNWKFGLAIIRAAEIFAIFAVIAMLVIRGWGGMWPRRVSTSGLDFAEIAEGSKDITEAAGIVMRVLPELVRLEVEKVDQRRSPGGDL